VTYYAVIYQSKCVAKIVIDENIPYVCPFLYDELVQDDLNLIPVANGDQPSWGGEGDGA
jgi:hypothetical protein